MTEKNLKFPGFFYPLNDEIQQKMEHEKTNYIIYSICYFEYLLLWVSSFAE